MAAWYAGIAFVVWQVADIALPALGAPEWAMSAVVVAAIVGSPFVLASAWIYDLRDGRLLRTSLLLGALDGHGAGDALDVPEPPTPFVGRDKEIAEVKGLVETSGHRLVSIVGPGGMGKTRLALRAARSLIERFRDGVTYVALDGIDTHEAFVSAMGHALGIRRQDSAEQAGLVLMFLSTRSKLLVLDGVEDLVSSAEFVTEMLEASAATSVLLTTRVPLTVRAEAVYRLGGLRCRADGPESADGVELFRQVASRRGPRPDGDLASDPWIGEICRLVDGSPLGIELAASWTGAMTTEEIARELETSSEFLEARDRDVPQRQRSLGVVLDSTFRRLGREERRALSGLAVFEGDFSSEEAAAVSEVDGSMLSELLHGSCVQRTSEGSLALSRTLRQYVRARTPDWPESRVALSHAAHFANVLASLAGGLGTAEHGAALSRFELALPDVVRAWLTACEHRDVDLLLVMVQPLRRVLEASGRSALARELISSAIQSTGLEEAPAPTPDIARLRGHLLGLLGHFERLAGDMGGAVRHLHASVEALTPLGRSKDLAFTLNALGDVSAVLGRYDDARRFCDRARAIFSEVGDEIGIAASSNNLGVVAHRLGDLEHARACYRASLEACDRLGDLHGSGYALNNLGVLCHEADQPDEARDCYQRAVEVAESVGDRYGLAAATANLARLDLLAGRIDDASRRASEARVLFDDMGDPLGVCACDLSLGDVSLARDDLNAAERAYRSTLRAGLERGAEPLLGEALIGIADVLIRRGRPDEAEGLLAPTLACEALDRDAMARRDALHASLATGGVAESYRGPPLREVARRALSHPTGG